MSGKRKRRKSKCKNFDHKKQKNKPFDEKMESSVNCEAREVGECDSGCSPHEYSFNGFVVIPERQKFFDQIKIGLHERQFVLVQGAMGCGKTSSIRLIADDLNMQVNIIQMSDQIDSKSLFGSFHCLDVPGDILWKASNFTNAIRKRGIILIKDIDCASADLISTLIDFCENRKQFLTTGEIIHMHDEAFIVATMRLPKEDPAIISVDNEALISSLSFRVVLPAYTDFELIKIIKVKYRRIANYAQKIVEIFNEVANAKIITNRRVSRKLTINDLMRACNRLNNLESMLDNISLLSELLDAWVVHCLKRGEGIAIGQIICKHLSVNYDMVNFLFNVRQPDITFGLGEMVCGRTTIPIFQNFTIKKRQISFGKTREACQLIERVAVCIKHNEAVLLVGETGVGKTSAIQAIASHLNANLRVINLSQQSESSDLIGGYKPVSLLLVLQRLRECFDDLFRKSFNCKKNGKFYEHIDKCLSSNRYEDYVSLILGTANKAIAKFHKVDPNVEKKWADIFVRASRFQKSLKNSALPFAYICGIITEAAKNGDWLLIDEINLAPVECLDAIVHVLDDADKRHPNFRLFACMNPATDVMKKNLPIGIRSRFTEIFVAETIDIEQLMIIASTYLPSLNIKHLLSVLQVHIDLRAKFPGIYSLRTLCRALMFASDNIFGNDERNVFEAVAMSYMTNHSVENQNKVEAIIKSYLKAPEQKLKAAWLQSDFIQVQGYNIRIGTEKPLKDDDFIITPSVSKNLALLARIVCSGRFPVLLEGETSTGKTSMIIHLSKITGNVVFRINNHEHTDLQEYIGSYVPDENGRLVFVEGALLKAMQAGHWVILDELNLAPGDVTEALNRLLDDNRELYVPELNKTIKAHRNFRLFATQNPFANYAGRKRLSRALLNRFVILKFSRLPTDELYSMVHLKCQISESAARLIISVLKDLRARRSYTGMFSMHDGFMTLRDVFKWANRFARSDQIDWRQCLADHGFMVLCARCRTTADENLIKHTIEHYTSRKIIPNQLFAINSRYMPCITEFFEKNVVPTFNMRRMIVLCSQAWIHNEPVLLVGETGCGKTTVAQLLAKDSLLSLNCQERTDTCDLLGSIRPGENGTFKWFDGVVVTAMRSGRPVLLDEISLASDSVLERLNPLLEPSRSLFLTESGTEVEKIVAEPGFQIISTMNPGGDYGKKELSKALRNRFTEIWCPAVFTAEDVKSIICHRLSRSSLFNDDDGFKFKLSSCMARFLAWYFDHISKIARCGISLRDVVAFVEIFISSMKRDVRSIYWSVYEAFVAIDDGISLNISDHHHSFEKHRFECQEKLKFILMDNLYKEITEEIESPIFNSLIKTDDRGLIIGGYLIEFGAKKPVHLKNFVFNTDWFEKMSLNIARALSIDKPILIQGEPGCGKSSIVVALAAATGHHLTRLNLSEQTELSDLFGTDVPTVLQDGRTSFEWKDGPLLTAINNGHWILLDEMNLASQSILEGLNACFDHRHQLFIPELNRMFEIGSSSHNSKFFACQNPHNLGGNRRALPKSFLNRFSVINTPPVNDYHDYLSISSQIYGIQSDMNQILNKVNRSVKSKMLKDKTFAKIGGPYEFNIRDVLRWSSFISEFGISNYPYELLYVQRFRTEEDREVMREIYKKESGESCKTLSLSVSVSDKFVRIGRIELIRSFKRIFEDNLKLLPSQASILEHLATCVRMNWISLIVGESKIGKSSVVKNLAALTGNELKIMRLTSETDASELIGSFEQIVDYIGFTKIKNDSLKILSENAFLASDIQACEDVPSLRMVLQSAIHLFNKNFADQLNRYIYELDHKTMHFQWIDSPFLDAYKNGFWVLFRNVNMCSAAVLDRLNACLESDGELLITENGGANNEPIKAHPNFRIFFTMNDRYGPISRSMRNRVVEIYMLPEKNAWYKQLGDLTNVVFPPKFYNDGICNLPSTLRFNEESGPNDFLKLKILLDHMDVVDAFEFTNTCTLDVEFSEAVEIVEYPTLSVCYSLDQWKMKIWKYINNSDLAMSLIWAFMSSSFRCIKNKDFVEIFCGDQLSKDMRLLKKLIALSNHDFFNDSSLPYDERFDGIFLVDHKSPEEYDLINKFAVNALAAWTNHTIGIIESNSNSLKNYFMKRKSFYEKRKNSCIDLNTVNDEIKSFLSCKIDELNFNPVMIFKVFWSIILFVDFSMHASQDHDDEHLLSCIAMHNLKYDLEEIKSDNKIHRNLIKVIEKIYVDEKLSENKQFVDFYSENIMVKPYHDEEQLVKASVAMKNFYHLMGFYDELSQVDAAEESFNSFPNDDGVFGLAIRKITELYNAYIFINHIRDAKDLNDIMLKSKKCSASFLYSSLLKWENQAWASTALILGFLCGDFFINGFDTARINFDLMVLPFDIEIFMPILKILNFDLSLSGIKIKELDGFTVQYNVFTNLFWKVEKHVKGFSNEIKGMLYIILDHLREMLAIEKEDSESSKLSNIVELLRFYGLQLLMKATPPLKAFDPAKYLEQNRLYLYKKQDLIKSHLSLLQNYRMILFGNDEISSLADSKHPLIFALTAVHSELNDSLERSQRFEVFRSPSAEYFRLTKELNFFTESVVNWHKKNYMPVCNLMTEFTIEELLLKKALYEDFLLNGKTFCNRLVIEFATFPDLTQPYIIFFQCTMLSVAYKRSLIAQACAMHNLQTNLSFPTSSMVKEEVYFRDFFQTSVFKWCLSNKSVMPVHLQISLASILIEERRDFALHWLQEKWYAWYKQNVCQKEDVFTYRSSRKNIEQIGEDSFELEAFLPDYSKDSDDFFSVNSVIRSDYIYSSDLIKLLSHLENGRPKNIFGSSDLSYMPLMWLFDFTKHCGVISGSQESLILHNHYRTLTELKEQHAENSVDVYHRNNARELLRCTRAISALCERVRALKIIWPEITVLDDIIRAASRILDTSANTPIMRLATLLERLLEECENWEKIAAREYSLIYILKGLRQLLLDWRKMEILCWSHLLDEIQDVCFSQALLISWPLFDAVVKNTDDEIITMLIAWIQQSTIGDFNARLRSASLLQIWCKCCASNNSIDLPRKLLSVQRYFEQYKEVHRNKRNSLVGPIESKLKDFIAIAKFSDLNLWSVKSSAEKNHQQLFRMVKQFKLCLNEPMAPLFDESLSIPNFPSIVVPVLLDDYESISNPLIRCASKISHAIVDTLRKSFRYDEITKVIEICAECDSLIREQIIYEGDSEKKEKEQGRALNIRQKAVARFLKEIVALGIRSRKGLIIDGEELTAKSMINLDGDSDLETIIRRCVVFRNLILKALQKPNTQLSSQIISNFKGISEFILHELISAQQIIHHYKNSLEKLMAVKKMLCIQLCNMTKGVNAFYYHYERTINVEAIWNGATILEALCEDMKIQFKMAPLSCDLNSEPLKQFDFEETPLSKLNAHDVLYSQTMIALNAFQSLITSFKSELNVYMDEAYEKAIKIWSWSELNDFNKLIDEKHECSKIFFDKLSPLFPVQILNSNGIFENMKRFSRLSLDIPLPEVFGHCSLEPMQLFIQNIFKKTSQTEKSVFMDSHTNIGRILKGVDMEKFIDSLWNVCNTFSNGKNVNCVLVDVVSLCKCIADLNTFLVELMQCSTMNLALFYLHFGSLSVYLLQKGYVNAIPKVGKFDGAGENRRLGDDGVAGMGDGEGDRDVGDEMDNMGQIEGLKDDNHENQPAPKSADEDVLIDVDDEFDGDMEDIDREMSSESEDDGENEVDADQIMGEIDDSEENQLDPGLWDNEQNDESFETSVEEQAGTNAKTQNLAPADNPTEIDTKSKNDNQELEELENVDEEDSTNEATQQSELSNKTDPNFMDDVKCKNDFKDDTLREENKMDQESNHVNADNQEEDGLNLEEVPEPSEEIEDGSDRDFDIESFPDANAIPEENMEENKEMHHGKTESIQVQMDTVTFSTSDGNKGGTGGKEGENIEDNNAVEEDGGKGSSQCDDDIRKGEKGDNGGNDSKTNDVVKCSDENNEGEKSQENIKKQCRSVSDYDASTNELIDLSMILGEGNQSDETDKQRQQFFQANDEMDNYAHKSAIDKSTVQEAKASRSVIEKLRETQRIFNDIEEIGDSDLIDEEEMNEELDKDKGMEIDYINAEENKETVIQATVDLYQFTESIVSSKFALIDDGHFAFGNDCAADLWAQIENSVVELWPELAENLRMIIEPTKASKLEGDYRSGKRLNMRRLISYIASDFRKNRIWMRRTRRAQRNYQVLIAVDDSASMLDRNLRLITCQSVCMIDKALSRLEIGQLALCKFGKSVKMLKNFGSNDVSLGGQILNELTFKQNRTDLANLMVASKKFLDEARGCERCEQMLIIISDGLGVYTNGTTEIIAALKALQTDCVTVLFVAMDSGKNSLTELSIAKFSTDGSVELIPYMKDFPFHFYILIRHITSLPAALAEAIRQWFELTRNEI